MSDTSDVELLGSDDEAEPRTTAAAATALDSAARDFLSLFDTSQRSFSVAKRSRGRPRNESKQSQIAAAATLATQTQPTPDAAHDAPEAAHQVVVEQAGPSQVAQPAVEPAAGAQTSEQLSPIPSLNRKKSKKNMDEVNARRKHVFSFYHDVPNTNTVKCIA